MQTSLCQREFHILKELCFSKLCVSCGFSLRGGESRCICVCGRETERKCERAGRDGRLTYVHK